MVDDKMLVAAITHDSSAENSIALVPQNQDVRENPGLDRQTQLF